MWVVFRATGRKVPTEKHSMVLLDILDKGRLEGIVASESCSAGLRDRVGGRGEHFTVNTVTVAKTRRTLPVPNRRRLPAPADPDIGMHADRHQLMYDSMHY